MSCKVTIQFKNMLENFFKYYLICILGTTCYYLDLTDREAEAQEGQSRSQ